MFQQQFGVKQQSNTTTFSFLSSAICAFPIYLRCWSLSILT